LKLVQEPTDDLANGLVVTVALRPKPTATIIDDDLYSNWLDAWVSGVKSKLMLMPRKKWTSAEAGTMYYREYWDGLAKAKIAVNRQKMVMPLRATPKYSFV
jgi:hypothetical protein